MWHALCGYSTGTLRLTEEEKTMPKVFDEPLRLPDGPPFKVFGIGLSRTGSNTLGWMLGWLGWRTAHYLTNPAELDAYDAVVDTPTNLYALGLALRFPDARFILTMRGLDDWLGSMKWMMENHPLTGENVPVRLCCYGGHEWNPERMTRAFELHQRWAAWFTSEVAPGARAVHQPV